MEFLPVLKLQNNKLESTVNDGLARILLLRTSMCHLWVLDHQLGQGGEVRKHCLLIEVATRSIHCAAELAKQLADSRKALKPKACWGHCV